MMRQGQAIQHLAVLPPSRHALIHQSNKQFIVMPFQQVGQFVRDDILSAYRMFEPISEPVTSSQSS